MDVHLICNVNSYQFNKFYPIPKSQIHVDWDKFKPGKCKVALEIYTITVTDNNHYSYKEGENYP